MPVSEQAGTTGALPASVDTYSLDQNLGYLLRRCYQASTALFAEASAGEVSAVQFAALVRLCQDGPVSQNRLGRSVASDAATIKGVVDRLRAAGAVTVSSDPGDRRHKLVTVTDVGRELCARGVAASTTTSGELSSTLSSAETALLVESLTKVAHTGRP